MKKQFISLLNNKLDARIVQDGNAITALIGRRVVADIVITPKYVLFSRHNPSVPAEIVEEFKSICEYNNHSFVFGFINQEV